jgi:hypothetical protein
MTNGFVALFWKTIRARAALTHLLGTTMSVKDSGGTNCIVHAANLRGVARHEVRKPAFCERITGTPRAAVASLLTLVGPTPIFPASTTKYVHRPC